MCAAGRPSKEDVDAVRSPFAATMLDSLPCGRPMELHKLFPAARCLLSRLASESKRALCCVHKSKKALPASPDNTFAFRHDTLWPCDACSQHLRGSRIVDHLLLCEMGFSNTLLMPAE